MDQRSKFQVEDAVHRDGEQSVSVFMEGQVAKSSESIRFDERWRKLRKQEPGKSLS